MSDISKFVMEGIGSILPYGDSNIDKKRVKNIQCYGEICEDFLKEIIHTASFKNRNEYSISKMGFEADEWVKYFRELLKDTEE